MKEAKAIKESIKYTGKAAKFLGMVATEENFDQMLRKDPKVLHISCHGIQNTKKTISFSLQAEQNEDTFLLFEGKEGDGRVLSAAKIQTLIKQIVPNLNLVFVAACHSLVVGKIF